MNICLISQEYPPETNWGGIATYTRILGKRLTEVGHRVHVVSRAVAEENRRLDGAVVVHRVDDRPRSAWPSLINNRYFQFQPILNFSARVSERIMEIHREEPIDVIESPETCAQAVVMTLLHRNIPVVTRLHTPHFWVRELNGVGETPLFRRRDLLERIQARCSRRVSSPTRAMASVVQAQWRIEGIDLIPNFFDLNAYKPDTTVYEKYLKGEEYILFFGRLEVRKGPHILSEAVPDILNEFPKLRIVFAGADLPHGAKTMRHFIESRNREFLGNLVFLDNMTHDLLYPIIENSKLVILPSLWENFPYACLEAMNFGKVVIGTRGSGFQEIINDGVSGILVDAGSPESLKDGVLSALRSMDLEGMGRKAGQRAEEFKSERVVPRIVKYYSAIVERAA